MRLTPSQIKDARAWLAECAWPDMDPEDFETVPDHKIERGIARHYDGGIDSFILSCDPE
jgi:hypothetical protein